MLDGQAERRGTFTQACAQLSQAVLPDGRPAACPRSQRSPRRNGPAAASRRGLPRALHRRAPADLAGQHGQPARRLSNSIARSGHVVFGHGASAPPGTPAPVSGRARQPDQNPHCSRHRGRSTRADKRCRATHLRGQRATVESPLVVAAEVGCVMTPSEIVRARSTRSFVDCAGIVMGPRGRLQRDIAVRRGLLPGVPALTKAAASHAAPPGPPLHKFMSCDACKTTIDLFHSQLRPRKFARTFAAQRGGS